MFELSDTRYHYEYIHNVFNSFIQGTMNYFSTYLYPRFVWKVIGTYDKAIERINKEIEFSRETDSPMRPGLILNPTGEMDLDSTYGKTNYRFPNFGAGMASMLFDPIYQDENLKITAGFSRIVGDLELIALFPSIYEFFDFKIFLLQIFMGLNRIIEPIWINGFLILPEDLLNYRYTNEYTGEDYIIDWSTYAETQLIKTTNKNESVYPFNIKPRYKLTSMGDASSRLGSVQNLPDWRLSFIVNYEIEIPSFIVLQSDYLVRNIAFNMKFGGNTYTHNDDYEINLNETKITTLIDWGLDSTSSVTFVDKPTETTIVIEDRYQFETRYYHILLENEIDSTSNLEIALPEVINDIKKLVINSTYGIMSYGDHYEISDDGLTLILKTNVLTDLSQNDVLELYVYKKIGE